MYHSRMSSPARQLEPTNEPLRMTAAEYLAFEEASDERHEFHDGLVVSMAASTPRHSLITANCCGASWGRLQGSRCRVYSTDLMTAVAAANRYVYPDVPIVCDDLEYAPEDEREMIIINPRLVIEVLSPSTEGRDRGEKFRAYRTLVSFREYVLVSQSMPLVETFLRHEDGSWRILTYSGLEEDLELASVGIVLPMAEIYANVVFDPAPADEKDVGRDEV